MDDVKMSPHEMLRAWLLANRPGLRSEDLHEDTDLIDSRVVDSLQFTELVLFVEQLSGRELLTEDLDPHPFRTLGRIRATFFGQGDA